MESAPPPTCSIPPHGVSETYQNTETGAAHAQAVSQEAHPEAGLPEAEASQVEAQEAEASDSLLHG